MNVPTKHPVTWHKATFWTKICKNMTNVNVLCRVVELHSSWPPQLQPRASRDLEEPGEGEGLHLLHQWSKSNNCLKVSPYVENLYLNSWWPLSIAPRVLICWLLLCLRTVKLSIPVYQDLKPISPTAARYKHPTPAKSVDTEEACLPVCEVYASATRLYVQ